MHPLSNAGINSTTCASAAAAFQLWPCRGGLGLRSVVSTLLILALFSSARGSRDEYPTSEAEDPVSPPEPTGRIEYPVRVMGTQSHSRLPDDQRCRWLPSGPDAWIANRTKTRSNGSTSSHTKTNNENTLDGMFRRIVQRYQSDEHRRNKLTIASCPDTLPSKVKSDYARPKDDDDIYDDDVYLDDDDDDPYHLYLHEGDGGPWVLTIDDFLDKYEAEQLVELGRKEGFKQSTVQEDIDVGEDNDSGAETIIRNSSTAWCQSSVCTNDAVYRAVTNRVFKLVGMDRSHSEDLQLLRYFEGEFYKDHHDYYKLPDVDKWSQDGGRILTVFFYLNDVSEDGGGETFFPRLNLTITPKIGRLVVWPSVLDHDPSKLDWRTEHSALEITNKGIKHGANLWFHLKPQRRAWFNYECDAPLELADARAIADRSAAAAATGTDGIGDGDYHVIWNDNDDYYFDDDEFFNDDDYADDDDLARTEL